MRFRNTRTSTINAKVPTFDEICEKAGFGDLKVYCRYGNLPLMRGAVWHYMHSKGVRLIDIARQSNRSHATVWSGIRRFKDYLSYGDRVSLELRDKINEVLSENVSGIAEGRDLKDKSFTFSQMPNRITND